MITRIVRMSFQPEHTETFEGIFDRSKEKIRAMPGCRYLSLHRDHHHSNIYYTISRWDQQSDLDYYRASELFKNTWKATKALFDDKPAAFSLDKLVELH